MGDGLSANGSGPESPDSTEIQTLFLVVISLDGQSRVVLNPEERFTAQRLATPNDVYPSLANVLADYQAIKTAEAVLSFQSQLQTQLLRQRVAEAESADAAEHEKAP